MITMGMILHDWNLEKKKHLVRRAYDALPPGGAFVVIENLIDDARRENAFGLMMSLNMLIEFGDAFDFTGADFSGWCRDAGFRRTEIIHLAGPASAASRTSSRAERHRKLFTSCSDVSGVETKAAGAATVRGQNHAAVPTRPITIDCGGANQPFAPTVGQAVPRAEHSADRIVAQSLELDLQVGRAGRGG